MDALLGDEVGRSAPPTLDRLLDAARHIPLLLLSYGGPAITLEDLVARVRHHHPVLRALSVPYRHLSSIASEVKNATNKEFLVVAGR